MLQIIGFVYGLIALITGKFYMSKTKKAVGPKARLAGLILVLEPLAAFCVGLALALAGVNVTQVLAFGVELGLLIAAFVVAFRIAGQAAQAQQALQGQTGQSFNQTPTAKAA